MLLFFVRRLILNYQQLQRKRFILKIAEIFILGNALAFGSLPGTRPYDGKELTVFCSTAGGGTIPFQPTNSTETISRAKFVRIDQQVKLHLQVKRWIRQQWVKHLVTIVWLDQHQQQ